MADLQIPALPRKTDGVLEQLGQKYRSGKAAHPHYYSLYERYLAPMRHRVDVVLELGVEQGKSLLVWMDYFPQARVIGVDSNLQPITGWPPDRKDAWRVGMYQFDQCDEDLLAALARGAGGFDLIVDDASHDPLKQKKSLDILWPYLKKGGLYVIEDLETSYWNLASWNQQKLGGCIMEGWENPAGIVCYLQGLMNGIVAQYAKKDPDPFPRLPRLLEMHWHPNIVFLPKA